MPWLILLHVPNVPDGPAGSTLGTYADQAGKSRAPARAVQPGTTATGRGRGGHRAVAGNAAGARAKRATAAKTLRPAPTGPRTAAAYAHSGQGGPYKMTPKASPRREVRTGANRGGGRNRHRKTKSMGRGDRVEQETRPPRALWAEETISSLT